MKVIFLDNDGVICLNNNYGGRTRKWSEWLRTYPESELPSDAPVHYRFDDFDKKAIKVLNRILDQTGAEIVVSSDWRKYATLEELGDYYIEQGIRKRPIDVTKFIENCDVPDGFPWHIMMRYEQSRACEIKQYLNDHPEITHWVAIDDLDMGIYPNMSDTTPIWGLPNFVRCLSLNEGIKRQGLEKQIISFLK